MSLMGIFSNEDEDGTFTVPESDTSADTPAEPEAAPEPEPEPEPEKPKPVKKAAAKKPKARSGYLTLEAGDNPSSVARRVYGRASMGQLIAAANPGVRWKAGVEIKLPEAH